MALTLRYVRAGTLELLRYPAFSLPTLLFPTVLFLILAAPSVDHQAAVVMAGFAATALLGVAFFQFGVGIAVERSSPWEAFLRTLPAAPATRVAARALSALLYGAASAGLVIAVAVATTPVSLSTARWLALLGILLAGATPFALFGIALGYWVRPRAALPVANLVFLPLGFVGGLFTGPRELPDGLSRVSSFLPTRQWAELLWGAVEGRPFLIRPAGGLAAWTAVFTGLAILAYRHDEGERFG